MATGAGEWSRAGGPELGPAVAAGEVQKWWDSDWRVLFSFLINLFF